MGRMKDIHAILTAGAARCTVCSEPVVPTDGSGYRWAHATGEISCGTGDGASAYPPADLLGLPTLWAGFEEVTCRWHGVEIRNIYVLGEMGLRTGQFVVLVHDIVAKRFEYDNLDGNESAQSEAASTFGEQLAELLSESDYVRPREAVSA